MSRLAWFPLYVDDLLGGTSTMLMGELGSYLAALLSQWQSGDLQAIPDNEARLARICGGEPFPPTVRLKFERIMIDGKPYLRNKKLATIWKTQKAVHEAQSKGGKKGSKLAGDSPSNPAGDLPSNPPQNPEPRTENLETQNGERSDPPAELASPVLPEGMSRHPAVVMYFERFRLIPAIVAQERAEAVVGDDLEGWRENLDYWEGNDHRPNSVWKMLDRYEEQAGERKRANGKAKPSIYDPVEQEKLKTGGARLYPDGFYRPY